MTRYKRWMTKIRYVFWDSDNTLVKTAHEVRRRHEQHLHALLHRKVIVSTADGGIVVTLDISVEDESPSALLAARRALEPDAAPLAEVRVDASFKLTDASARAWIADGYRRPG
jgi:FMN phosphatase YigB (HAD superfamily)